MSKISGLGATLLVGGYDLSGDISSLDTISGGPAALDVTSIKSFAVERIGGLRTGDLQFTSWFDIDAGQEHAVLSTLPVADVVAAGYFASPAIGDPAYAINGKQLDYDPTRGADGSLSFKIEVQSNAYGLEWGELLTAGLRTDTSGTAGSYLDGTASSSFGAQAYLQVTNVVGTSVTVTVEHCATSGGSYASLIAFNAVLAGDVSAQRGSVTGSVDQYVKVTTTGTFSSATFAVAFMRNATAVVF